MEGRACHLALELESSMHLVFRAEYGNVAQISIFDFSYMTLFCSSTDQLVSSVCNLFGSHLVASLSGAHCITQLERILASLCNVGIHAVGRDMDRRHKIHSKGEGIDRRRRRRRR